MTYIVHIKYETARKLVAHQKDLKEQNERPDGIEDAVQNTLAQIFCTVQGILEGTVVPVGWCVKNFLVRPF